MATRTDLSAPAAAALACLGVDAGDHVLVLYNDPQRAIAESLADAARPRARSVELRVLAGVSRHNEEPPAEVADAIAHADVVFGATSFTFTQTQARVAASERGVRVATLPTITEEIFVRAVPIDYAELARTTASVADRLSAASSAHVTSTAGTDIVLSLEGRTARRDDGDLRGRGSFGNLPAGEGYIAPIETVGDGTIVFDGSVAGLGVLESPIRVDVEAGRAVAAEGELSRQLLALLDAGNEFGRSVGELGVGTNSAAVVSGNVLEDEKVVGTIHIAFGSSAGFGGVNVAGVHIDGIVLRPTLELDGAPVVRDGRLLLD